MAIGEDHARYADDVGAYVLGALSADESAAFERHIEHCHVCAEECERLRLAADALPRGVAQLAPPPSLKRALMATVKAEAAPGARTGIAQRLSLGLRGLTPVTALAAAIAVLVVGAAIGFGITSATEGGARVVSAQISGLPGAKASLVIPAGGRHGAVLHVAHLRQPGAGRIYETWLLRDGKLIPASLFGVRADGSGAAAIPGSLSGVTAVLVTNEASGGATAPTGAPLMRVKV